MQQIREEANHFAAHPPTPTSPVICNLRMITDPTTLQSRGMFHKKQVHTGPTTSSCDPITVWPFQEGCSYVPTFLNRRCHCQTFFFVLPPFQILLCWNIFFSQQIPHISLQKINHTLQLRTLKSFWWLPAWAVLLPIFWGIGHSRPMHSPLLLSSGETCGV